ncbi:hypothetical protein A9Q89_01515 [Gammaproteobacteria bacterium 53_120_T64]|nr:hypothetical protein A9Q89_01515 [Gammaproteobacteria bacterium 53_120_T64]
MDAATKPALLIVDDQVNNLYATKKMLDHFDIEIYTALSGREALQAVLDTDFFLILMDVNMPDMDGIETVSLIRGNNNYRHIPIIFITAEDGNQQRLLSAYNEGGVDFITKPFHPKILSSKIELFLNLTLTQQKYVKLATSDVLTGLANRQMYAQFQETTISYSKRNKCIFAVLFLDLDHFKEINDTLGHDVGDLLLKEVSQRIKRGLRQSDFIARMGGDEFAIILTNIHDPKYAGGVAQQILKRVGDSFDINGVTVHCGASIGIACYPSCGDTSSELNKAADIAMYKAKEQRQNVQFFSNEMQAQMLHRLALIKGLKEAIGKDEFSVLYQKKVSSTTLEMVGVEALLRWNHATLGPIPPGEFIPLAEETGLIGKIGAWVLETVAQQIAQWQSESPVGHYPCVAVNVSPLQLNEPSFGEKLEKLLIDLSLPPGALELELTETAIMQDPDTAIRILSHIQKIGVRVSVDDFGTGYSSFSYLRKIPIDYLKIDLSFTQDIGTSEDADVIVRAIINLAHTLKFKVVAEGVESQAQVKFLTDEGCDYLQGYYFGRPSPADDFSHPSGPKVYSTTATAPPQAKGLSKQERRH